MIQALLDSEEAPLALAIDISRASALLLQDATARQLDKRRARSGGYSRWQEEQLRTGAGALHCITKAAQPVVAEAVDTP